MIAAPWRRTRRVVGAKPIPEPRFLQHLLQLLQAAADDTIPLPEARSIATALVRERIRELFEANNRTAAMLARRVRS